MVAHLEDGWELADYSWEPKTGVGTYTYERKVVGTNEIEASVVEKAQPYHPSHTGWYIVRHMF